MGRSKTSKRLSYKDLEKVFEIDRMTISWRIRKSGMGLKEALETPPNSYIKDLTGERFTRLVVQYLIPGNHRGNRKWHCLCDCGNECDVLQINLLSGRQKSCGCLNMENRHKRHKDMSGKVINGVKIKQRVEDEIGSGGKHYIQYLCECPYCGSDFISRLGNIKSGNTGGCGCTRHQYTNLNDLTGLDFEFCHVNKRLPNHIQPAGGSRVMYECTCCCGRIYSDWAYTILHGRSNCGCQYIVSKNELNIQYWLEDNNIPHCTQYWFNDLRSNKNAVLLFDFALLDNDDNLLALVEFQGEQHYHENPYNPEFGKFQREVSDPMKKDYCKKNNIQLFEIAYYEDAIEKIKNICNLLYHDNTVPSSQETA